MAIPDGYNTMPTEHIVGTNDNNNVFQSDQVVANPDGSILERMEDIRQNQWRVVSKALAAADLTGTVTRFTVSGVVKVTKLGVHISTALPAGANTLKFQHTPTGGAATDLCGVTDTASAALNSLFLVDGVAATGLVKAATAGIALASEDSHMPLILAPGVIKSVFSAGPPATGAATLFVEYEPLTPGASIA
jgi:hypothetical protein